MKKTSRRKFGKQLTGVLAAFPVVSLASRTSSEAQTPRVRSQERIFYHQDTPPPLVISDGSLIVESDEEFAESGSIYTGAGRPKIGHIRVLRDNGDKIYEDLDAEGTKIDIGWINEDKNVTGHIKVSDGTAFKIDSDKRLGKATGIKKRRAIKYDHPGNAANKRIRVETIEITNPRGAKTTFTATPTDPGPGFISDEFRILIWRE